MPSTFPSPQALYQQLMMEIEPELLSEQLPLLAAKYAGETAEQKQQRAKRYQWALAEYDRRLQEYFAALDSEVSHTYQVAFSSLETATREEETLDLQELETTIAAL